MILKKIYLTGNQALDNARPFKKHDYIYTSDEALKKFVAENRKDWQCIGIYYIRESDLLTFLNQEE